MTQAAVQARPLRASEIPQMVDVDGHIDESLMRTRGCYVRSMAEVLEEDDTMSHTYGWESTGVAYRYVAAEEYLPQPPWALDAWERELHGVQDERLPVSPFAAAPGAVWIVGDVEDPRAPTVSELRGGTRLPADVVVGFDGSRSRDGLVFLAAVRDETTFVSSTVDALRERMAGAGAALVEHLERLAESLQPTAPEQEPLIAERYWLNSIAPASSSPSERVREQALNLRRHRNTGPDEQQFRHRGQR